MDVHVYKKLSNVNKQLLAAPKNKSIVKYNFWQDVLLSVKSLKSLQRTGSIGSLSTSIAAGK